MIDKRTYTQQILTAYNVAVNHFIDLSAFGRLVKTETAGSKLINLVDFGDRPKIRKVTGAIPIHTIGSFVLAGHLDKYAQGIAADEDELQRHGFGGAVLAQIAGMGEDMAGHAIQLLEETVLPALKTSTCLDGQAVVSANHPTDDGVQSNLVTSLEVVDVDAPTMLEIGGIFDALRRKIKLFKSDTAQYRNANPEGYVFICPPEYADQAEKLFSQEMQLINNQSNPWKGYKVQVIGNPYNPIATTAPCQLFAYGSGIKQPFTHITFAPPKVKDAVDPRSDEHIFISTATHNVFPLEYRAMIQADVAEAA